MYPNENIPAPKPTLQTCLTNPGTTYTVEACLKEVKQVELTKNQKRFNRIQLHDGQQQRSIKLFEGNNPSIMATPVETWLSFDINAYVSTFDNKVYLSGFWNSNTQVIQQQVPSMPRPTPQGARQRPPAAAQGKKSAPDVDWDAKDLRMAKCNALNNAVAYLGCGLDSAEKVIHKELNHDVVITQANRFLDWIYAPWDKTKELKARLGKAFDGAKANVEKTAMEQAQDARKEVVEEFDKRLAEPTKIPESAGPFLHAIATMQIDKAVTGGILNQRRHLTAPEKSKMAELVCDALGHWPTNDEDVKNVYDKIELKDFLEPDPF